MMTKKQKEKDWCPEQVTIRKSIPTPDELEQDRFNKWLNENPEPLPEPESEQVLRDLNSSKEEVELYH